ncbi:GrpB family protein [soil metagenome]
MLVAYDPHWNDLYGAAASDLHRHGDSNWPIEHIGSTSVPGLAAKPIIDLAVCVDDTASLDDRSGALEKTGWLSLAAGPPDHAVRIKQSEAGVRTHIAHFFSPDQWNVCHQRLFAARDHSDDRDRYARLKDSLLASGLAGRGYTAAKAAFVQEVVDRAAAARGLPRILLNEE